MVFHVVKYCSTNENNLMELTCSFASNLHCRTNNIVLLFSCRILDCPQRPQTKFCLAPWKPCMGTFKNFIFAKTTTCPSISANVNLSMLADLSSLCHFSYSLYTHLSFSILTKWCMCICLCNHKYRYNWNMLYWHSSCLIACCVLSIGNITSDFVPYNVS